MSVRVTVRFPRDKIVAALRQSAAAALNSGAVSMQGTMKNGLNSIPAWGSRGGGWPGKSTGGLAQSIRISPANETSLVAMAGTNERHGRFMQIGVRKRDKWLTVPVSKRARDMLLAAKSVTNIGGLVWIPGKPGTGGNLAKRLGNAKGTKPRLEVLFALKASVSARPWGTLAYRSGANAAVQSIRSTYAKEWNARVSSVASSILRGGA